MATQLLFTIFLVHPILTMIYGGVNYNELLCTSKVFEKCNLISTTNN